MREHERSALLHHFLIDTAIRSANSLAIANDEKSIVFGDLLQQSTRLAATLRDHGLGKGERVAVIMPKSIEAVVSIFATLFNGGIYVPLDPHWPSERMQTTLADCTPRFVIRQSSVAPSPKTEAPGEGSLPVIVKTGGGCIQWHEAVTRAGNVFSEPDINADDPALILFTSGSTGRPKGVTLSHGAVAAFVMWAADEFRVTGKDRLACPSPLSFDLSAFDIYAMALRGATCVIVPEQIAWMPRFLTQFAAEQKISVWYSVPSILSAMLFDGGLERYRFPELRVVAFAGEVFPSHILERWRSLVPEAVFYNLYGPTETNVVTWYKVPNDFNSSQPIPIGKACPYAELAFDPKEREESGSGFTSELLVAGKSVMLGYWNKPEETERVFAKIPDAQGICRRFYRTGDRIIADAASGNYTFGGRKDRQVKRRGFRIELEEIERVLSRHPRILEAAAVSSEDRTHQAAITAFVRFHPGLSVSQIDLRIHCAGYLPSYMMPDRIIPVQAIPKGNRGKMDYGALIDLLRRI